MKKIEIIRKINSILDGVIIVCLWLFVVMNTGIVVTNDTKEEVFAATPVAAMREVVVETATMAEETTMSEEITEEEITEEETTVEETTEEETTVEETTEEETTVEETTAEATTEAVKSLRDQFLEVALSYVGTPYVFGGEDPRTGIDCSRYVQLVSAYFGIELPRNSAVQFESVAHVSKEELLPGDLVFYDSHRTGTGVIGHVAIYIGNGQIVHARSEEYGVCINNIVFNDCNIIGYGRIL